MCGYTDQTPESVGLKASSSSLRVQRPMRSDAARESVPVTRPFLPAVHQHIDPQLDRIATPHGTARSSFKDWCRQNNRFPDEWSELALAHVNSDQTRAAYARGELLEERRGMMEEWGQFCEPRRSGGGSDT